MGRAFITRRWTASCFQMSVSTRRSIGARPVSPRLLPLVGSQPHLLKTPQEDRATSAFELMGKGFEQGRAPLLLSWWTVKSSYGGEPREHSYPWVLPQPVTVRRLTFGVARSA
jgi:hypothetical protein